jgi:uncharacterized membrane protein YtjA (UPF0391 family)
MANMALHWLVVVFSLSVVVTAVMGFTGLVVGAAAAIAKILFCISAVVSAGLLSAEFVGLLRRIRVSLEDG